MSAPVAVAPVGHVLACRSFVLGTCNLLIIGLPPGWRLLPGAFPPEVDRWRVLDECCWALAGRGSFRALPAHPGRRLEPLEGRVEIWPWDPSAGEVDAAAAPLAEVGRQELREAGGHVARCAEGAVTVGLGPWRRRRPAWAIDVCCPVTGRRLRLTLVGNDPARVGEAAMALAAGLRCH